MHKSSRCFYMSLDTLLGEITFDQSFVSKHEIFSFENYCLAKKRRTKKDRLLGHFINFGVGEQKPSVSNLKHKHPMA